MTWHAFTQRLLLSSFFLHTSFVDAKLPDLHRRQSVPSVLPGNWTSLGCYTDGNPGGRTLNGKTFTDTTDMTIESCINFCDAANFIYAGVEFTQECYCDDGFRNGGAPTSLSDCNMACKGNPAEVCGAGQRLNVFWSGVQPPPQPVTVPSVGNWVSLGCYSDNVNGRALTTNMGLSVPTTIEACTAACFAGGFRFSGTEFSGECYCGSAILNGGAPAAIGDCNMVCAGNATEFCGGPNRLNMYNYTGTDLPAGPANGGGGGGNGGQTTVSPVTSGLPSTWAYAGCWVDNAHGRIFDLNLPGSQTNTIESCIAACSTQNFTVAGTEFSDECYCGNRLVNGAVLASDPTSCNMGCAGNETEACGGPNRLSVYSSVANFSVFPVPTAQTTDLPGQWTYAGCFTDTNTRILPWQNIFSTNNSVANCASQCGAFGYTAAGVEFGDECYCGDVTDIAANGGTQVAETDCNIQCSGDPIHLCGGGLRLNMYTWNGTVNVWHTPENTGYYEYLVPGLVVPLVATVGINNKVSILEKTGTGFPNSTGAYELDLTLVSNFSECWREMHVKTDVFCSGSIILPDKGGRQINIGGWSGESTFGIRLYAPDGTPGVNGTNDWEENGDILKLQRGRWYPTTSMLPNGSILVIGGEIGSNDKPQPNLEILPFPEDGYVKDLDWLQRTDPWNLYPFVVVLPSGNLFIAYYNEARILDASTFDTVKELPNMPAAVNDFLGGRTYPLEGSLMLFPMKAPYTDPLKVLICGGSTPGPAIVLDNCISIEPEVENPVWTVERMPSRRVMSCMSNLPDGTFLMVNGAHKGVAGFGLASDPNLQAVLYDPEQVVGQRMSILNSSTIPRLYHSEATLLPDGRVLISGSDPQTPGFDEELRIEVYVPPYLNQGLKQPTFDLPNNDVAYGEAFQLTGIHLFQGPISNIKISLIFATSSTHGNTMGARTLFPAFSCSGTTCTVTAPPNANISPPGWHQLFILDGPTPSVSKWIRIGGDPARIGDWPQLPGFTTPGV